MDAAARALKWLRVDNVHSEVGLIIIITSAQCSRHHIIIIITLSISNNELLVNK